MEKKRKDSLNSLLFKNLDLESRNARPMSIKLSDELESFIENLLEQERKRMSEEVKKLYSLDYMKGSPAYFINRVLDKVLSIINK